MGLLDSWGQQTPDFAICLLIRRVRLSDNGANMNSGFSRRLTVLCLYLLAQVGIAVFGVSATAFEATPPESSLSPESSDEETPSDPARNQDSNSHNEADSEENEDDTTIAAESCELIEPLAKEQVTFTHEPGFLPAFTVDRTSRAPPHAAL